MAVATVVKNTGWSDEYVRKELPIGRFTNLLNYFVALEDTKHLREIIALSKVVGAALGGRDGVNDLTQYTTEIQNRVKEVFDTKNKSEFIFVKNKMGEIRKVYAYNIGVNEETPKEFIERLLGQGADRATFGGR